MNNTVTAFIEMLPGDTDKWELDKATYTLGISRKLDVATPAAYGFIKDTRADDGDEVDVFVVGHTGARGIHIEVVPVMLFHCEDNGVQDDKFVAIPKDLLTDEKVVLNWESIDQYLRTYKPGFVVKSVWYLQEGSKDL